MAALDGVLRWSDQPLVKAAEVVLIALLAALCCALTLFLFLPAGSGQTAAQELWQRRNVGRALYETPATMAEAPAEL